MKNLRIDRKNTSQSGVALIIALFVTLLVSVIALSLMISASRETTLAGNYRTSTGAYYASSAGIEEGRAWLLSNIKTFAGLSGSPSHLARGKVIYITNPVAGENVLTTYPDVEYDTEFGNGALSAATKSTFNSVWTGSGTQGPLYKWVRINAATKYSLQSNVDNTGTAFAVANASTPLYYDSSATPASLVVPGGTDPTLTGITSTQAQAFEVTALAVMPNGSQKILQYVVTQVAFNLSFPGGALTLAGSVAAFNGANSNPYYVNGTDGSGSPPAVSGCTPNQPAVPAIGVTSTTAQTYVTANLPRPTHYVGSGGTPSVVSGSLSGSLQSAASVDQLVQTIQGSADATFPNPPNPPGFNNSGTTYSYGQAGWPAGMSATNPKVVYVDGSFDLGPNTGYGLLVVTGNFSYNGNSGWKGIILVVGDGTTTFNGSGGGNGEFDGAVFVATTRDSLGNQLANFGSVNFDISGGGGNGIYYNSCWINDVQPTVKYQILSFREK